MHDARAKLLFCQSKPIECFHPRGQHLCKLLEQKKAFAQEKSSTPTGLVLDTNMAAVSLFWDIKMAAVMSCERFYALLVDVAVVVSRKL